MSVEATDGLGNATLAEKAFVVAQRSYLSAPRCTDLGGACQTTCECCPGFECHAKLALCVLNPG